MQRALERLEDSAAKLKESISEEFSSKYEKDILTEIITKRFEYTFESLWKFLKEFLLEEGIESNSPLSCFKESFALGLIDKKHEEIFPLMVKKRNEVVHIYSDEDAYEICLLIKNSFSEAIFDTLQKIQTKKRI